MRSAKTSANACPGELFHDQGDEDGVYVGVVKTFAWCKVGCPRQDQHYQLFRLLDFLPLGIEEFVEGQIVGIVMQSAVHVQKL